MAQALTNRQSKSTRSCKQRGIALLLVLAMIVLVVPLAVGLAQLAISAQLNDGLHEDEQSAHRLLLQVERGPILHWLRTESAQTVVDPDLPTPRVDVLQESWEFQNVQYHVQVSAWDQCGMIDIGSIQHGSPLRSVIPTEIYSRLSGRRSEFELMRAGLDEFMSLDDVESRHRLQVFPEADADDVEYLGAWIATHCGRSGPVVNVNTAPPQLLEAAMELAGRGSHETILAARQRGEPSPLPFAAHNSDHQSSDERFVPHFVSASTVWAVRFDIGVGMAKCSWWAVYEYDRNEWKCVQRIAIPN